jgi:ATP-dependent exoDNAse (exonuclease V) beta subunit
MRNIIDSLKGKFRDKDQDKRLLYVAMTRSTDRLMLTYQKQPDGSLSPFVIKLLTALQALG